MKLFKLHQLCILLASFLLCCSCNDDADTNTAESGNGELAALTVKTDIAPALRSTNTKSGTINSFAENSRLGLFITHFMDVDAVFERYGQGRNVCSIYNSGYWHQQPPVMLDHTPVQVFAYCPYADGNDNPRQIPIEHTSQTDYLYGTHSTGWPEVNKYSPEVKLSMKHALSLVEFHIEGLMVNHVDYIEMANLRQDGTGLHSRGTLDISTGEITCDASSSREVLRWQNDGTHNTWDGRGIPIMVIPASVTTAGGIGVHFKIDGEPYTWIVPTGTNWKGGTRNTYHLFISGKELHVRDVFIEPWLPGIDEMYPLD